ncbi:MAG: hypothetical protein SNG02_06575 [Rikenellaceae bacterium]
MKRVLKYATVLITSALLFVSCEKFIYYTSLNSIVGVYSVYADSYLYGGDYTYDIEIIRDDADDSMVWIYNLDDITEYELGSDFGAWVYGVVDSDVTKIIVPLGQSVATGTSNMGLLEFYGYNGYAVQTSGYMIIDIIDGGLKFYDMAPAVYVNGTTRDWWDIFEPGMFAIQR